MTAFQELADARYINLETFKRDGSGVRTPVWAAPMDDQLVVFTNSDSYKVKRLRRDSRVRMARCNVRGAIKGDWYDGQGTIVADAETERAAYNALRKKYGWQMWLADVGGKISGRDKQRSILVLAVS